MRLRRSEAMPVQIAVVPETFRLAEAFTISRGSRTEARVLTVHATAEGVTGRGECVPYARYGETMESVRAQIGGLPGRITRNAVTGSFCARRPMAFSGRLQPLVWW